MHGSVSQEIESTVIPLLALALHSITENSDVNNLILT